MEWKDISSVPKKGAVDLWVRSEAGGERYADMVYVEGGPSEPNDWVNKDDLYSLSDCCVNLEDITHWMRVEGPEDEV